MSFRSSSSFSSGVESLTDSESSKLEPQEEGVEERGDEEIDNSWESGAFSVLYQVSKEQPVSWVHCGVRLFFDWLQVFLIVVNPRWGWDINTQNSWWLTFSFLRLEHSATVRGYTFLMLFIYIWVVSLALAAAACIWAAAGYKANDFKHTWVVAVLRQYRLVFLQILDVAGLTLLLIPLDCQYWGVSDDQAGHMVTLPHVYCFAMPHLIHLFICAIMAVVFLVLAAGFYMAEVQTNLAGRAPYGMANTQIELYTFSLRMFMVLISTFLTMIQWKSVFLFISAVLLCFLYLRWLPHQYSVVNCVRVGSYFSIAWASVILLVVAYHPGSRYDDSQDAIKLRSILTQVMWALLFPMGALGGALAWKRKQRMLDAVYIKFRDAPEGAKTHHIHAFKDAFEVEVASRCCRCWGDEDSLDPDRVEVGTHIVTAGARQLPRQPYAKLLLSAYMMDVVGSYHSGYSELKETRRMPSLSMIERYLIFIREQENILKSMAVGNEHDNVSDLADYVEYQRNMKLTIVLHRNALLAKRSFWVTLQHRNVTFNKVAAAVARIERTVRTAERMYKQVLSRHAGSLDLLTLYVKFLQSVRDDPWSAANWATEVEKLQRVEEETSQKALMGQEENHDDGQNKKGVIVIGANCIMRMVNETAAGILGYASRNDLMGNNVNIIVPPPFSRNHNNYIRNYIETGVVKIMNAEREVVAVHKLGYVIPINILITKVSGVGEDSVFMGVFEPVTPEPNTAMIWVMNNGSILSCDKEFTNWFGYRHEDIQSHQLSMLMVNTARMDELLESIRVYSESRKEGGKDAWSGGKPKSNKTWNYSGNVRHTYLGIDVPIDMTITVGGFGDTAMFLVRMKRRPDAPVLPMLLVTNSKGAIVHATSGLATRLGTTVEALQATGQVHALDALLPAPFVRLHHQWCRNKIEVAAPWGCNSGLTMCLNGRTDKGPCCVPFGMQFKTQDSLTGHDVLSVVELEERTFEQMLDERRMSLLVNKHGIVQSASASPISLFGLDPTALVGSHIAYIIDVLQPQLPAGGSIEPHMVMEAEEEAAGLIATMAERSYEKDGMSWRVGVTPVMDPVTLVSLGPIAKAIMADKMIPAVMAVKPYIGEVETEGATMKLPTELLYQVEIWRADLLAGVIEVDMHGIIESTGVKDQPVFNPETLLGLPANILKGAHISTLLPCGKAYADALFTENSMAPKVKGKQAGAVRSVLRAGPGANRRRDVGPLHTVRVQHGTDGGEIELQVQAITKVRLGVNSSLYITLHVHQPRCGSPAFAAWLNYQPAPGLPLVARERSISNVGSASQSRRASVDASLGYGPASRLGALDVPYMAGGAGRARRASVDVPSSGRAAMFAAVPANKATRFLDVVKSDSMERSNELKATKAKDAQDLHRAEGKAHPMKDVMAGAVQKQPETGDISISSQDLGNISDNGGEDAAVAKLPLPHRGSGKFVMKQATQLGSDDEGTHAITSEEEMEENDEEEDDEDQEAEEEEEMLMMQQENQLGMDSEGGVMDNLADLKRGKRLRRLTKTMMSPLAQAPALRLRYWSIVVVAALVIIDIAMFVIFWQLLTVQRSQVKDLRSTSRAANRVMQVASSISALQVLLSGGGVPTLKHLGQGGTPNDVAYTIKKMEKRVADLDYYHRGVYRGFGRLRRLPTVYGLRELWETPSINIKAFYKLPGMNEADNVNMSLWDVGNEFVLSSRGILQNFQKQYGLATGRGPLFMNDTNALLLLYNAPRGIMAGYLSTLDGLMRKAVDDSKTLNNIQLIILAVEGVVVGTLSVIVIWFIAQKSIFRRFVVFSLFMMVPPGIVRTLATQPINVGLAKDSEGQEQDGGDDNDYGQEQEGGDNEGAAHDSGGAPQALPDLEGGAPFSLAVKVKPKAKGPDGAEVKERRGCFGSLISRLAFWRLQSAPGCKRRLQHSPTAVIGYTWPFMFWMVLVIMLNSIGYMDLKDMSQPIAVSNLVQFVYARVNRMLLIAQRYASKQYFALDFTGIAPVTVPNDQYNPMSSVLYNMLKSDYPDLRLEYSAMLYGANSPLVENSTRANDPHFALATQGIVFTQGASLMYKETGCLAADPVDCYTPDETFYRFTEYGLDQAMKQFFVSVEGLLLASPANVRTDNPDLKYIWEVGSGHIAGGLSQLTDIFVTFVDDMYQKAFILHVVALVLCVGLSAIFLLFVLRPAHAAVVAESRRCAQLFSALPPEYDIEGMLASTTQVTGSGDAQSQMEASKAARDAARASTTASLRKIRSSMNNGV